jgi:hypothetical protein
VFECITNKIEVLLRWLSALKNPWLFLVVMIEVGYICLGVQDRYERRLHFLNPLPVEVFEPWMALDL